jgi:hypothetical protein
VEGFWQEILLFFGSLWLVASTVKSTIRFFVWELKKCLPKVHKLFFIFSIEYSNYWDFVMLPPLFTVSRMVLKGWNFPTGPGPRILKLFEWLLLIILKAFFFCVWYRKHLCFASFYNHPKLPENFISDLSHEVLKSTRMDTNQYSFIVDDLLVHTVQDAFAIWSFPSWFYYQVSSLWFLTSPYTTS